MSTGAVFKLIANDGKADRMIMATKLLNQRIKDVMCARNAAGKADITPTLVDLERTHILYVNAHFKPFAAIGYEYNKVRPQSGSAALGTGVTFSIPQFGDFFHDMVCRVRLTSCSADAVQTPQQGTAAFPWNQVSGVNEYQGQSVYYNIVDAFGNVVVAGGTAGAQTPRVPYQNLVRYCEYPGNRLFNQVKFDVNGNPLDAYDEMVPTMLEKFCTLPHKRAGFNRLVGQEVILDGYTGPIQAVAIDNDATAVNGLQTPANIINRNTAGQSNQTVVMYEEDPLGAAQSVLGSACENLNIPAAAAQYPWGAYQPQYDISRQYKQFVSGPQTPKPTQPILEIWNKLRFWFNDDVRLSIPSVSIPFGQRFISIELTSAANLVFEFPGMYLETVIDNGVAPIAPFPAGTQGIIPAEPAGIVGPERLRQKVYAPLTALGGFGSNAPSVDAIELYINNIFVNPEVHDIYIKRIGFSLIRVYRQQRQRSAYGASELLLSQLKWPIEYMFIGARPQWNINAANNLQWRDWHRLSHVISGNCDTPSLAEAPITEEFQANSRAPSGSVIGAVVPDQYYLPVPTVDSMALTSHGIVIFDNFADTFFSSYMPFHYGGTSLCTPDDVGALFVNMALFPRSYQPSGHLNISRARETYLKWNSTYISSTSPVDFIIVAVAINFLLITDGSAVLRYST